MFRPNCLSQRRSDVFPSNVWLRCYSDREHHAVWQQPALTFDETLKCGGKEVDAIDVESCEWPTDR
jgi:hypothetical protein